VPPSAERLWIDTWKAAGPALEEQRRVELRTLTPERALFLADAVLSLAQSQDLPPRRRTSSGLVELQALFGRLQSR